MLLFHGKSSRITRRSTHSCSRLTCITLNIWLMECRQRNPDILRSSFFSVNLKNIFHLQNWFSIIILLLQMAPSFSFSVQLTLQEPNSQNSLIIKHDKHSSFGLISLSFSVLLCILKGPQIGFYSPSALGPVT